MARLTKTDWLEKGLDVLNTRGYANLRIEFLCAELKVSKGSFYHHFNSIDNYVENLMMKWEEDTYKAMAAAKEETDPKRQLNRLQNEVFFISPKLEVVVRAWSTFNPIVEAAQIRIDKERISFMASLYTKGKMSKAQAKKVAAMEYAVYIGMQTLYLRDGKKKASREFRNFEYMLLHYGKDKL